MWRLAFLATLAVSSADDTFFLKPNKTGVELALAIRLRNGNSHEPPHHRRSACPLVAVWVAVTPSPSSAKLEAVLKQMTAAGMQANRTVLFAHSLGGVMAQNWLDDASKADGLVPA